jgi:hypothetical protein
MAKYFARACPKCNGYLGVVVPPPERKTAVRPINGLCLRCGYRLVWMLILGGRSLSPSVERSGCSIATPEDYGDKTKLHKESW